MVTASVETTPPQTAPVPVTGATTQGDQAFPQSLMALLSPPLQTPSSGPEPPGSGAEPTQIAEGAAKNPTDSSQKLDSPRNERKAVKVVSDPSIAASSVMAVSYGFSGLGQSTLSQDSKTAGGVNSPTGRVSGIDEVQTVDQGLVSSSLLPKDQETEILSVQAFSTKDDLQAGIFGAPQDAKTSVPSNRIDQGIQGRAAKPTSASSSSDSVAKTNTIPKGASDAHTNVETKKTSIAETNTLAENATSDHTNIASNQTLTPKVATAEPATPKSDAKPVGKSEALTEAKAMSAAHASSGGSSNSGQSSGNGQNPFLAPQSAPTATNATSKSAESTNPSTPIDQKSLVNQVASRFAVLAAANPKNGVVVQLAPKALGAITVTMKNLGGQIDTHIAASNSDVRSALEQSRPELASAIQSQGYSLSKMTITSDSDSTNAQGQSGKSSSQQNPNQNQPKAPIYDYRPNLNTISHTSTRFKAAAGVDLWI